MFSDQNLFPAPPLFPSDLHKEPETGLPFAAGGAASLRATHYDSVLGAQIAAYTEDKHSRSSMILPVTRQHFTSKIPAS